MRICVRKSDKRIIEMQSDATEGTLIRNAISGGYSEADIEERAVDEAGYEAAKAQDPVEIAARAAQTAQEAAQEAKAQAFLDNLPSWAAVSSAVDNIANLADAKAFIKKLARVVYWLARGTQT